MCGLASMPALQVPDLRTLPLFFLCRCFGSCCASPRLRLPPVFHTAHSFLRVTQHPTRVGKYLIPGGTPVAIPLFVIHNTKHNWEAPQVGCPLRWKAHHSWATRICAVRVYMRGSHCPGL